MEMLYEDLFNDVKGMLKNKERKLNINNVKLNRSDSDSETHTTGSNFNNGKMYIDEEFCRRLVAYLDKEMDKSFPSHTKLKSVLTHEIKKIMNTDDDKEIKKVVEKIRDIILKERVKYIDNIEKRVAKVMINKY